MSPILNLCGECLLKEALHDFHGLKIEGRIFNKVRRVNDKAIINKIPSTTKCREQIYLKIWHGKKYLQITCDASIEEKMNHGGLK